MHRWVWLGVVAGCASEADMAASGADVAEDTGSPAPTQSGTDTAEAAAPAWRAVEATLAIVDGAIDVTRSTLTVTTYDAALEPLCDATAAIRAAEPALSDDDAALALWAVTPDGTPCGAELLTLGLAPYDPQLDPARVAHGYDDATPFSALLGGPDDTLWVYGIAGTDDQLAGAATADVVEDGGYTIAALILTPWGG